MWGAVCGCGVCSVRGCHSDNPTDTSGKPDKMVDALTVLKQRATADDPTALFTLVSDLGKVGEGRGREGRGESPYLTAHMTTCVRVYTYR